MNRFYVHQQRWTHLENSNAKVLIINTELLLHLGLFWLHQLALVKPSQLLFNSFSSQRGPIFPSALFPSLPSSQLQPPYNSKLQLNGGSESTSGSFYWGFDGWWWRGWRQCFASPWYFVGIDGWCGATERAYGGPYKEKLSNIKRAHDEMDYTMWFDYFMEQPKWEAVSFWRHYHIQKSLFLTIMERMYVHDSILQKGDVWGIVGLSSQQKTMATLLMFTLEVCIDAMDEYCKASKSTVIECMKQFCKVVCEICCKWIKVRLISSFGGWHLLARVMFCVEYSLASKWKLCIFCKAIRDML